MKQVLKILIVDGSEESATLISNQLSCGGFEPCYRRVKTAQQIHDALNEDSWDIILSDIAAPNYNGPEALRLAGELGLEIPFVLVSPQDEPEAAVELTKCGAYDFIVKSNLARLNSVVSRELASAENRRKNSQAEAALRKSQETYRELVENINDVIFATDIDGVFTYLSPASKLVFGEDPADFIGHCIMEFVYDDDIARIKKRFEEALFNILKPEEFRIKSKSGKILWIRTSSRPIVEDGKVTGLRGVIVNITGRKKAEEALRESEEKYRTLVEMFPHIIAIFQDGKTVYVNQSAIKAFGVRDSSEIIGHDSLTPVPEKEKAPLKKYLRLRLSGDPSAPESYQVRLSRADGSLFPAEIFANQIIYNGRPASQVLAIDITERLKSEEALRQSEERYRTMVETAGEGIWVVDAKGVTAFVNQQMADIMGYTAVEMIGRSIYSFMDEESKLIEDNALERRRKGARDNYESRLISKSGKTVNVSISATPLLDPNSKFIGALAMITDITQRIKAEARSRSRNWLLFELHVTKTIQECLQKGCEALQKANISHRVVFLLAEQDNTKAAGHVGLSRQEQTKVKNASFPKDSLLKKIMRDKNRIGRSFIMNGIDAAIAKGTALNLISENVAGRQKVSDSESMSLFHPIGLTGDKITGWLAMTLAPENEKPDEFIIRFIEDTVEIVMMRIGEIQRERKIVETAKKLEEKNTALKEIMSAIESEKTEIRTQIVKMVDQMIKPSLNRLIRSDGTVNKAYFDLLSHSLDDLALATGGALQMASRLSPRELEICALIRGGASSKVIAETLDISLLTVQKHREVIRRKLGLTNKNVNLMTHLRNMQ